MLQSALIPQLKGYIDGKWTAGRGQPIAVRNPADGELLAEIGAMGRKHTEKAIAAAQRALTDERADLDQRSRWLIAIAEGLTRNRVEIGRILTCEHGKPLQEAAAEVDYAAGFFGYCGRHIDLLRDHVLDEQPRNCRWTVRYGPAGVVGLITPWNFPIGMIAKKLSAAIAADCSSIVKPSSKTPLTMIALFKVLHDVGLPAGKVNLVIGPAGPIAKVLCTHPAVRVVSFTGSTEVGKDLMKLAAGGVKRLTLELGGNAPFVVFEDADLDAAADQLMVNKFRGAGQTCVCANRIFVQAGVVDAFSRRVVDRVKRLKVGDGLAQGTDIGPLIDKAGYDKVRRHTSDAVAKGARVLTGNSAGELTQDFGAFFTPTVLQGVTDDMLCCREETFGPLVPIASFNDERELIRRANNTQFGLAAYVFTRDEARASRVIAALQFQHVGWNTGTGPTPEAPFGGMKQSGFGREGGREGLFEFVEPQTVPRAM